MTAPDGDVRVRPAAAEDLDTVLDIIAEVSRWLEARGIRQWGPAETPVLERKLGAAIAAGETWLAEVDGVAAATVTLQWSDVEFWGEQPDDAGYVHRLAVRRAHAGRGLGRFLLRWAEERTAERGRPWLRLDVMTANPRLRRYYEEAGFVAVAERDHPRFPVVLYEKAVGG